MAQNNLRVLYNNLADAATVTTSSTVSASMTAANLKSDYKGLVWRTATSSTSVVKTQGLILTTFSTASIIGAVILAFNNLKVGAKIRVYGYTGTAPVITAGTTDVPAFTTTNSNLVFDTGSVDVNKPATLGQVSWGFEALGITGNEIRKNYSVVWVPAAMRIPVTSLVIEITNSDNIDRYIEVSRLILGNYWSPKYNTSFGLSVGMKDTSTSERSESGDLITTNGFVFPSLSFDLAYLDIRDRNEYNRLVKSRGRRYPMFISLFPEETADPVKEQMHQVYGKLVQLAAISHPIFDMYATQVEIEEI